MSRNDVIFKIVVPILAGLLSGLVVFLITPDWQTQAMKNGWVDRAEWQAQARRLAWLPLDECPNVPTRIVLESPGNGSTISLSLSGPAAIESGVVVSVSKPITMYYPPIGLLFKRPTDSNYYVVFPVFDPSQDQKHFKADYVSLPFDVEGEVNVDMWAFYAEDRNAIGHIYTSVSQLESLGSIQAMSSSISWTLTR